MNKIHAAMLAFGLLSIGTSAMSIAADSSNSPSSQQQSQPAPADPSMTPNSDATPPANTGSTKNEQAYQAKLKKCDGMSNAKDKKMCSDKVRKERDQM